MRQNVPFRPNWDASDIRKALGSIRPSGAAPATNAGVDITPAPLMSETARQVPLHFEYELPTLLGTVRFNDIPLDSAENAARVLQQLGHALPDSYQIYTALNIPEFRASTIINHPVLYPLLEDEHRNAIIEAYTLDVVARAAEQNLSEIPLEMARDFVVMATGDANPSPEVVVNTKLMLDDQYRAIRTMRGSGIYGLESYAEEAASRRPVIDFYADVMKRASGAEISSATERKSRQLVRAIDRFLDLLPNTPIIFARDLMSALEQMEESARDKDSFGVEFLKLIFGYSAQGEPASLGIDARQLRDYLRGVKYSVRGMLQRDLEKAAKSARALLARLPAPRYGAPFGVLPANPLATVARATAYSYLSYLPFLNNAARDMNAGKEVPDGVRAMLVQ